MSYCEAMEAAGAEVLAFQEFGSYQGEWWAKVKFEGETGWILGYYGSCSGCDAFQAEFGWDESVCEEHRYEYPHPGNCSKCDEAKIAYQTHLADFGRGYITGGLMTDKEALKESLEYDYDSYEKTREGEQTEFIKAHLSD